MMRKEAIMSDRKHPEFKLEKERLDFTRSYMKMTIKATEMQKDLSGRNIKEAMLDLDDLDSSQNYIDILINTRFMEMAEKNYLSLTRSYNKPYFARVDFKAKGTDLIEKIYIGKTSLMKEDDDMPIIVDWRAPISNIYYEGRLGETSYESQGDMYEGDLLLKRQFNIEKGELLEYMDIDVATTDVLLQASLEAGADNRLKDIATTIQAEQNRVIRADMRKPLIVQGVAGSGKTTIALHRIAYFIYTYQDVISPDQFMIMAPNHLFLNYISQVLPELGVEKVRQTTFEDFFYQCTGIKHKLTETMATLRAHLKDSGQGRGLFETATFKGSLRYRDFITQYFKTYELEYVKGKPLAYEGHLLMSGQEVKKLLLEDLTHVPLYRRTKYLEKTLKTRSGALKEKLVKRTYDFYDGAIEKLIKKLEPTEERREKVVALMEAKEKRLKMLEGDFKVLVRDYLKQFEKITLMTHYVLFLEAFKLGESDFEQADFLVHYTLDHLTNKKIDIEDCPALLYLHHLIFGLDESLDVKTIVIDEAQDFSPFQVFAVKSICKTDMMTLLGDISQGIHSYRGVKSWRELIGPVFSDDHVTHLTLEQSYRTTVEIMDFANGILSHWDNPECVLAHPVIRHGQVPEVIGFEGEEGLLTQIESRVRSFVKKDYQSVAILCKTDDECALLQKKLKKRGKVSAVMLSGSEDQYEAGVVLMPAYVAKGLEFDAVIVVALSERFSEDDLDIKLLYVASTRAMHEMSVYGLWDKMPVVLQGECQ